MAGIITCRAHRGIFFFFSCSCETAFFICALFLISPCCEEQMAYSEVAVMCAEGWTDECLYIFVVYTLSLSPYLDPLCRDYYCQCICVIKLICICVIKTIYIGADERSCVCVCVCSCTTQRSNQSPLAGQERVQCGNEGVISLAGRLLRY